MIRYKTATSFRNCSFGTPSLCSAWLIKNVHTFVRFQLVNLVEVLGTSAPVKV